MNRSEFLLDSRRKNSEEQKGEVSGISERLEEMKAASPKLEYYALTLTASEEGRVEWSTQSGFLGTTKTKPPRILRAAVLVNGEKMLNLWESVGTPGVSVQTKEHLGIFLHLGGNAIVERSMFEKHFSDLAEPQECVPSGPATVKRIEDVSTQALQRAPTAKLRGHVIKRDDFRCRVCGRRATDNVDIELHVHHFRPWSMGGLTEEENLVTLCSTCHRGLDPHFDLLLVSVFPEANTHLNEMIQGLGEFGREHADGVRRYREVVRERLESTRRSE